MYRVRFKVEFGSIYTYKQFTLFPRLVQLLVFKANLDH